MGIITNLIGRLYDSLESCRETYERDHTMTEEDYEHPGCMLKLSVMRDTEWMKDKYPLSYRMAVDQASLDEQRAIDCDNYMHRDV